MIHFKKSERVHFWCASMGQASKMKCGHSGEGPRERFSTTWKRVTCKKCHRARGGYLAVK